MSLALYIGIIALATVLVWKGSDLLEESAQALAAYYTIPPAVEGAVVIAVGSSLPELATTVISAAIHDEFHLGVSVIVGSAVFNILVIPGLSAIAAKQVTAHPSLVYKDAQFYVISILAVLLVFALAVLFSPVEGERMRGELTRSLALIPLGLYLVYLFLQHMETLDYRHEKKKERRKESEADSNEERIRPGRNWLILAGGMALITVGVEGLIRSALFLGDYFETPGFLWGVTVIAAATSIPDALVSIRVAMHRKGDTSIGNVLGSNVFDLLVAIPAGVMVAGASVVDFTSTLSLMTYLVAATVLLFVHIRIGWRLTRSDGIVLLSAYLAFVIWMVLETTGVVRLTS